MTEQTGAPTARTSAVEVIAHRGFSGRHPESTRAAYQAAIELASAAGRRLELECDVLFSRDRELVVRHDRRLARTGLTSGWVSQRTVAELKQIDFGRWKLGAETTPQQRELVTLDELLQMAVQARDQGIPLGLAVEVKRQGPHTLDIARRAVSQLAELEWTTAGSPVRLISFDPEAVRLTGRLAPGLRRSLLVEKSLGEWADGHLPDGVDTVGVDHRLATRHPDWVDRLLGRGHHLHLWTVNEPGDMVAWLGRGATGLTTDHPDRALAVVPG